ncbi:Transcriptional regulatory protein CusR [Meiothermus luteus]|jgi:DNA-binding response OmpR family regulator|uniref:Transcriptional regulatory protein CusR n=1 Tax=Meiothermus luteus TaxID=2026184 RepID=A0A399EM83_9DEIN|nr:response regulator transcription factor [Meiothermus luteus]RIH84603.1 Transcriptional regulatory protein CusR [Meiothermus luteus]RMH57846.1 MAG: response regulator [Deinococcota bacterium]
MRILLVEDELDLGQALTALLRQERYEVGWATCLEEAYRLLAEAEPDLLVLDVMLPEGENAGFELARKLRESGFLNPILFLTARDALDDRVEGLDLGGDDYLTKPFDIPEFLARVRALLRRESQVKRGKFERGPLRVDFISRRVYWNGQEVALSKQEFALLEAFALHPEKVFTLEELLLRFFPEAASGVYAVRMGVARLRSKLGPDIVVTVPGGYRLGVS